MLKYLGFLLMSRLVPLAPVWLSYGGAWIVAEAAFRLARGPRRAVTANLRQVLGATASTERLASAVRGVFHTAAYNYVDMLRIPRLSPAEIAARVDVVNEAALLDAHRTGRGVVIATAHLGNFDLLVQVAQTYAIPVSILVEPLSPERLFRLVCRLRGSHGIRLLPSGGLGLRRLLVALREGEAVAIAADRDLQRQGRPALFFGRETSLPTGAAQLALRTGALIVPAFGERLPGRRYRLVIEDPLDPEGEDEASLMAALAAIMERHIGGRPEQWVVFEPRWSALVGAGNGEQERVMHRPLSRVL